MSIFRRLDDTTLATGQVTEADVRAAAADGVTRIICNRPDGEDPGQPTADEVRRWAEDAGLSFVHLPVTGQTLSPEKGAEMARAMDSADGPVLGYCKAGGRVAALWALGSAMTGRHAPDRILAMAANAGYDLSGLSGALVSLSEADSSSS